MAGRSFTRLMNGRPNRIRAEHVNELQVALEEDDARLDNVPQVVQTELSQQTTVVAAAEAAAAAAASEQRIIQTTVTDAVGEWWVHPLATYQDRPYPRTVFGAVASDGKVLACEFNHGSGRTKRYEVAQAIVDDHVVPAIWVADGRLPLMCWNNHAQDNFLHARVGKRSGDIGSFVHAISESQDIVGVASYAQIHKIEHLSDDNQDTFWVFLRRHQYQWITQAVSVIQETGAVVWGGRQILVDAGSGSQIYTTTAEAYRPDGENQVIRAAWGYNPANPTHSIYYVDIDVVTGALTSPVDPSFTGTLGTALNGTEVPAVAEAASGDSRRLFYVRPGPDAPAIAYADWTIGAEDNATYRVREFSDDYGHLVPGTGTAQAAYDATMNDAAGFVYTAVVKTPGAQPSNEMELGSRYSSTPEGWFFRVGSGKTLRLRVITSAGTIDRTSAESVPFTWGDTVGFRVTVDDPANTITWAYSLNPLAGVPTWTNLATGSTISGAVLGGTEPLIVPSRTSANAFAVKMYSAHLRRPDGTLLAGVDWRTEWDDGSPTFVDAAGRSWSLTGDATVSATVTTHDLGTAGPRVGYGAGSNYIAGLAFENPSYDRSVLRARSDGTTETVDKLRLDADTYEAEVLATQATADGRLIRPTRAVGGGPFAVMVTDMKSYGPTYTTYNGNIRGES